MSIFRSRPRTGPSPFVEGSSPVKVVPTSPAVHLYISCHHQIPHSMATISSQSPATPVTALPQSPASFPDIGGYVLPLISSPTNIVLFIVLLYVSYIRLRPRNVAQPSVISDEPIVFTYYTPVELAEFDGKKNKRILMGIRGRVYDVTAGAHFYGPSGPYGNFAGRDASRGLSKGSFVEGI